MAEQQAGLCTLTSHDRDRALQVPSIQVTVTGSHAPAAPAVGVRLGMSPLVVGTSPECDLVLGDPQVSRRHCELRLTPQGILLRDLGSKNGTLLGKVAVHEVVLPLGVVVTVGASELSAQAAGAPTVLPLWEAGPFEGAVGRSFAMRALFARLDRAAATDQTILLLGESGTGKEVLARAIHQHSPRRGGPFVVFDCGATTPSLVEAELFGHVRGAFTGAAATRAGLLEEASGGTLLIDEVGELPLELQPKLLRALEARQTRRIGASEWRPFDARIVAATHRDLRARVAEGSFREDLYYRLAVVEVRVPALRERKEDIPALVERFLLAQTPPRELADLPAHALALLSAHEWPGNVRELRNVVARLLLFPELASEMMDPPREPPPARPASAESEAAPDPAARLGRLAALPLLEARELLIEEFERSYLAVRLGQHGGNVSRAAEAMGVSRQFVHRLIERYELRAKQPGQPG